MAGETHNSRRNQRPRSAPASPRDKATGGALILLRVTLEVLNDGE